MTSMQRLEIKFGGTRRQVMAYLEEIDKFKPIRGERVRAQELERLADLLEIAVSNLKAAGKYAELGVGTLYTKIQQKLPEEMLTRFNRWVYENRETEGVEALLLWVNLEAQFHIAANKILKGLAPSRHATNRERQPGRGNSYYAEPEFVLYGTSKVGTVIVPHVQRPTRHLPVRAVQGYAGREAAGHSKGKLPVHSMSC